MVTCACNKKIEKVPSWLEGVNVSFICNNCPNRTVKGISEVAASLMPKTDVESAETTFEDDADDSDDDA
jgi:hypothetical protein